MSKFSAVVLGLGLLAGSLAGCGRGASTPDTQAVPNFALEPTISPTIEPVDPTSGLRLAYSENGKTYILAFAPEGGYYYYIFGDNSTDSAKVACNSGSAVPVLNSFNTVVDNNIAEATVSYTATAVCPNGDKKVIQQVIAQHSDETGDDVLDTTKVFVDGQDIGQ